MAYQSEKSKLLYDDHARQAGATDLHRQVWRSVEGKPIPERQIQMIVSAILEGLALGPDDHLLEMACGNGALSQHLIGKCAGYIGIDISECLIDVAKQHFEAAPKIRFEQGDALEFVENIDEPDLFSRMLCYAAFQYFPDAMIIEILSVLRQRFVGIDRIFIGNVPDLEHARLFFKDGMPDADVLRSNETPIGIWRSQDEFRTLCENAGWAAEFSRMPDGFYASAYRFDAVLTRLGESQV